MRAKRRWRADAFGQLDLMASVAGLALLGLVVVASLTTSRARSERLVCLNNLGQIGRAYQMWATDHDGWLPFFVPTNQGGIMRHSFGGNIYFQVAVLSNELRSASVLACPSDLVARRASNFSTGTGGLFNPGFQNNAVSYFVVHTWDGAGNGPLAGDRNLQGLSGVSGCPYFLTTVNLDARLAAWRDITHVGSGNILYQNGAAEQTGDATLRTVFSAQALDEGFSRHLVMRTQ
jgi:hypothetical protein